MFKTGVGYTLLIIVALTCPAAAGTARDSSGGGSGVRLGVCDWTIGKSGDPAALGLAGTLGLDGVQVSLVPKGDSLALIDPVLRRAYLEAVERTGVAIASFAVGDLNDVPLKSDPRAERWLEQAIDVAAAMNVKVILVPFFGKGDLKNDPAGLDAAVEALKRLAPRAEKAGVILALENWLSAGDNLKILERVGSPAVRVYYDVGNSQDAGHPVFDEIRLLGAHIVEFHAKDTKDLYGKGSMDFPAVRMAMEEIGYSGWLVLEGTKMPLGIEKSVRYDADYLKTIFTGAEQAVPDPTSGLNSEATVSYGEEFLPPKLIKEAAPEYPFSAMKSKIQGAVVIGFIVGTDGRVKGTKILKSIPELDGAAVVAVKKWVYEPFLLEDKPRPFALTLSVKFSASRSSGKTNMKPPKLIKQVSPVYPEEAKKSNIEGTVVLAVTIGDSGQVTEMKVLESVPGLDRAAIDAVKEWQYAGASFDGRPIPYVTTVSLKFSLNASKKRPGSNAAPASA